MVTKKDLKDIERQLQEIKQLYIRLGEVNPFATTTAQNYAKTVGSVDAAFTSLEAVIGSTQNKIIDLSSGLSDVNGQIKEILKGLGSKAFDDPFKNILKGAKGYKQIASQLSNIQEDLTNYSEKDLTKLIQKQKLIDKNNERENKKRKLYHYKVGQKVLSLKNNAGNIEIIHTMDHMKSLHSTTMAGPD